MRHVTRSLVALAMLATVTTATLATEVSYNCDDGSELTAQFSPVEDTPGEVVLTIAGVAGRIVLPQALSADGGRYATADTEFWIKGNSATLTRWGKTETCDATPPLNTAG